MTATLTRETYWERTDRSILVPRVDLDQNSSRGYSLTTGGGVGFGRRQSCAEKYSSKEVGRTAAVRSGGWDGVNGGQM